ncbi:RagB/SusD family nutrient uptake outer membrane protein [Tenacibaculum sp.]|nr:RagB/SusD family nutrient uptake outer membrane protein [Tenacibaculum sp.]
MKILQNNFTKLIAVLLLFTVISCDDFLSELPDNRTDINSAEKISALVTGAYPQGNYMLMAELMSDNAFSKNTTNGVVNQKLHEDMFNWGITNDDNQDTPVGYWSNCYEAISQANQALASIEELGNGADLSSQKGEALLARAYAHFMLVNFWGKHYDASTATTDLGVPYVLKPETVLIQKYTRNTVQEVYDLIEKDLIEGIALVEKRERNPKFHFSKEAGHAFASRFYTFKGDWDKVISHSSKAITNPRNEIRDLIQYTTLSYSQRTLQYNNTLENANILVNSVSSWWARNYASTNYGLRSDSQLFNSGNPFGKTWAYQTFGGSRFANLPKYDEYFKITNQSAGTGFGFTAQVLLSKDEVLLNRAEAHAMKGDYANSITDLTDFLSKKTVGFSNENDALTEQIIETNFPVVADEITPSYMLVDDKQTSFIKAILSFRQKEFYHEGLRWFDVRRFKLKIVRDYIKGGTTTEITLEKDDKKKQLQIPQSAINFGLTPNPR